MWVTLMFSPHKGYCYPWRSYSTQLLSFDLNEVGERKERGIRRKRERERERESERARESACVKKVA